MEVNVIALPNIQAMMTGVSHITYHGKNVTLHYVDGTHESGTVKQSPNENSNVFAIVGEVQAQRER